MTNGRCSEPTSRPSMVNVTSASRLASAESRPEHRGTVGHLFGRLQHVMVHEEVVVEDQSIVLDEQRDAGVLGAHGEDDAAAVALAFDARLEVPTASADTRGRRRRYRTERRQVGVVATGRMRRVVVRARREERETAVVQRQDAVLLGLAPPQIDQLLSFSGSSWRGRGTPTGRRRRDRAPSGRRRTDAPWTWRVTAFHPSWYIAR